MYLCICLNPSFCRRSIFQLSSLLVSQVKELKSRIADMGSQTRPSAGVTMLENKIQELEDRLRSEERYRTGQAQLNQHITRY